MSYEYNSSGESMLEHVDLEALARANSYQILTAISVALRTGHPFRVLKDEIFAEEHPELRSFTHHIGMSLVNGIVEHDEQTAAYQSFHMAYKVAGHLLERQPELDTGDFFDAHAGLERTALTRLSGEYYHSRPALCGTMLSLLPSLHVPEKFLEPAKTITGITFRFIEETEKQLAQDELAAALAYEMEGGGLERLYDAYVDMRPERGDELAGRLQVELDDGDFMKKLDKWQRGELE